MARNRTNVAMITEEDIRELLKEWEQVPAWIKAHVRSRCPAHRYEGELLIDGGKLVFAGRDIKEGRVLELTIPLELVTEVRIGFSESMKDNIDLAFGAGGPVPFVVCYQENGHGRTLYFNTLADNFAAHIDIDNIQWYETLDSMVTGALEVAGRRKRHLMTAW